jgi:hypothetical protein
MAISTSPNPGSTGNQLTAVAAASFDQAWAVGFFTDENFTAHTLIEFWGGVSWTVVPSPDQGSNGSYLQSVIVPPPFLPFDVWAVGYYLDDNFCKPNAHRTLGRPIVDDC